MKKVSKTAKSILVLPLAKFIANVKYERHLKKVEKEQEELLMGYDSPLLYAK